MEFTTIRQAYMYRMVECNSPSDYQLLDRILQTENSFQLHKIQAGIKLTDDGIGKRRNSVLEEIVVGRFTQHDSLLRPLFNVDVALPFIKACEYDTYMGVGVSPKELRWRDNVNVRGRNTLGELYVKNEEIYIIWKHVITRSKNVIYDMM